MDLNIVNLIHIGDRVVDQDDLSPEELREIRIGLNVQALTPLGYVLASKEGNCREKKGGA